MFEKISVFKIVKFALKHYIKSYKFFFFAVILLGIPHGLLHSVATLVFSQRLFDTIADVITKGEPLGKTYLIIIAAGAVFIIREILEGVYNFLFTVLLYHKPCGEIIKMIHSKTARIAPVCFEDTRLHDTIEKTETGMYAIIGIVSYIIVLIAIYVPYFIFMAFYLHNLQPYLIWIIVLAFVPSLFSQAVKTGIAAKFEDKASPIRREYDYYKTTIAGRTYYKETRKLGAYKFFLFRLLTSMKKLSKAEWDRNKKINLIELSTNIVTAVGYAGALYMLVSALISGDITAGAFAAVLASIGKLYEWMRDLIKEGIGDFAMDIGRARNFIRFMELPERGGVDAIPDYDKGIIAENISFTYPNAEHKSVDDVSLEIKPGETIAVVGANGAGKTTLVRLLMGLYTPTSGVVNLNGMDTSAVNSKSLFAGISGVFQNFQRYQMTLDENVKISDFSSEDKIDFVLFESGVDCKNTNTLPNGKETMLSREFDGVDLSGGEWQRIAIARGLYRRHNIIVLDEPTAAIDPIEESRIYRKFVEISKGKTAIIVTHRLGSAKIADRVIVMDKGKIINTGPHDELLQKCELYAKMFNAQAVWYKKNGGEFLT
ncbi:MAG: ABC transporter ATP-binding protein/permease [Oscillospiraceae bacterium]|nr:ABC transporter ATP-binding protein/permease [Oscillospiraceae bacterium]